MFVVVIVVVDDDISKLKIHFFSFLSSFLLLLLLLFVVAVVVDTKQLRFSFFLFLTWFKKTHVTRYVEYSTLPGLIPLTIRRRKGNL